MEQMSDPNWDDASKHLDEIAAAIENTRKMPGVNIGYYVLLYQSLQQRFNDGERTHELHRAIMDMH